jgi:hypothetical protein
MCDNMIGSIKCLLATFITIGVLAWPVDSHAKSQCEKHNSVTFKLKLKNSGRNFLIRLANEYSESNRKMKYAYVLLNWMLKKKDGNSVAKRKVIFAERRKLSSMLEQNRVCMNEVRHAIRLTRKAKHRDKLKGA